MKSVLDAKEVIYARYIFVSASVYEKILALLLCAKIACKTRRSPVVVTSFSYYVEKVIIKAHWL